MEHDLRLINIAKVYDDGTPAVQEFSLDVEKGEFIAFLGPSGCGKTTTLRMIAGFEAISSGDLVLRGTRINDVPPERRPTSMIFQSYALFPHMTVRGNVEYGLRIKRLTKADRNRRVEHILDRLDLTALADRRCDKLSGGQRQRIALARGLVVEPSILLLDEPLGALDANLRKSIQAELKLLQRNLGITFIFVTHAQSEALSLSDRVVVMNRGRIEQISAPYDLYTRPLTPFVAEFIGNNTIIDGTAEDSSGAIRTPAGVLMGTAHRFVGPGAPAKLVIPSQALKIRAATIASRETLTAEFGGNIVPGLLERRELIGHLARLSVRLPGGGLITAEGLADAFADDLFSPPTDVWIAWHRQDATIIGA